MVLASLLKRRDCEGQRGKSGCRVSSMHRGRATSFLTPRHVQGTSGLMAAATCLRLRGTYRRSRGAWLAIVTPGTL